MKLEDIIQVLKTEKLPEPTIANVVAKLKALQEDNRTEATPKSKHKYVIVLCDKDNKLAAAGDMGGFVVQMALEDDPNLLLNKIGTAVKAFNANTRKGRKNPIKTVGEAAEDLPRRFSKEAGFHFKTRGITRVITTDNNV